MAFSAKRKLTVCVTTTNMNNRIIRNSLVIALLALNLLTFELGPAISTAQNPPRNQPPPLPPTLGLDQGFIDVDTPDFKLRLVKASQTAAALQPKGANNFDFTPADRLERRAANGYHHLGDLTLRVRTGTTGQWRMYDTAEARKPVLTLEASGQTLAAADLTPTLPEDCPLQVTREWKLEDGRLVLHFNLKNKTDEPLQVGGLG